MTAAVKKHAKVDIKLFLSGLVLLDFYWFLLYLLLVLLYFFPNSRVFVFLYLQNIYKRMLLLCLIQPFWSKSCIIILFLIRIKNLIFPYATWVRFFSLYLHSFSLKSFQHTLVWFYFKKCFVEHIIYYK